MRISIVIAVLAILVAGGSYYGLEVYPQQTFRRGLDQSIATLPPGTTASYKDAHYTVMSHKAIVTGLTIHTTIQGETTQPLDVTVETIEMTSPNLDFSAAWAKAMANPAAYTPETALPVADQLTVKGLSVNAAVIRMTEDSVQVAKPRVYPWALLHDGLPSWKELQGALLHPPSTPDVSALQPILRAEAAVLMGMGYDSYDIGAMTLAENLPGIDIAYAVKHMSGGGFDRGVITNGSAETIKVKATTIGEFSVDRVTMGATDVREPMTKLVNGDALTLALLNGVKIGRLSYDGVNAQPPGQPMIHIGGFSIGPLAFAQGMPVAGELGWKDIAVTKAQMPDPTAKDGFDKLGLETVTISFALIYDWNLAEKKLSVHDTMLKVNELGTLTLTVDLTNVAPAASVMTDARLAHAKLRLDDASLVDRLLKAGAAQSGVAPDAFRQQISAMARAVAAGDGSPATIAAGQAASDFIASPHSLTIELSPPTPVPVMSLQGAASTPPARMAATLGLKVTANQ